MRIKITHMTPNIGVARAVALAATLMIAFA